MNVLILTPDAVGSTLLQRLITIYMQFHEYDRPVINLHELTNGIVKYYSPEFNRELLGKQNSKWGYHQSLEEVVGLLSSVDHYKTSRLAQYHIKNRNDPLEQQIPFYRYLDDNFYIISCRRKNVFEHSISWALNKITKKLNVYSPEEKINTFVNIYKDGINVDPISLLRSLEDYKNYLQWSENHFNIASYFNYEDHLPKIERYILDLPMFAGQTNRVSWNDIYGQEFTDWNKCHYYMSDVGQIAMNQPEQFKLLTQSAPSVSTSLVELQPKTLMEYLPDTHKNFLRHHGENYINAKNSIDRMTELGILAGTVPIKKQTLAEKRFMIKNFDQCVDFYNRWADKNSDIVEPINSDQLLLASKIESTVWDSESTSVRVLLSSPPTTD